MESSSCSMQRTGFTSLTHPTRLPPFNRVRKNSTKNRRKRGAIMHFSIYKKNITPIGFCLLLYFVTFRYKKCTEPTINIFYENMCHFTTAVCLSGVARTWSRYTLQSFQDFWKYPLHVFSCMCGFLCFSQMDAAHHCHTGYVYTNGPQHSIAHCLFCLVHRQRQNSSFESFKMH